MTLQKDSQKTRIPYNCHICGTFKRHPFCSLPQKNSPCHIDFEIFHPSELVILNSPETCFPKIVS